MMTLWKAQERTDARCVKLRCYKKTQRKREHKWMTQVHSHYLPLPSLLVDAAAQKNQQRHRQHF
jgi:hypothetical protein